MKKQATSGIGRREFIVMTSATAVAALAMGDTLLKSAPAATAAGARFALGFVDFERLGEAGDRFTPNAVSVDAVPSADGLFLRYGVRLGVRGYNVTPKSAAGREKIDLVVNYPSADGVHSNPYVAWAYSRKSGAGSPVSFPVPVSNDQHVRLLLTTELSNGAANASAAPASSEVTRRDMLTAATVQTVETSAGDDITFTLASEPGLPKLRRGFYIVTPLGAGASQPDWISLQLRKTDNGYKVFTPSGSKEGSPASFEYVVLVADYNDTSADKPHRDSEKKQ